MRALIIVDVQHDFMPGGALAVPHGDEVIPVVNGLVDLFDHVVATQDWHPPGHGSFASSHDGRAPGQVIELDGLEQVLWPDHCVQGTRGAELVETLRLDAVDHVVRKGTDPRVDSYSGFYDNGHRHATGLADHLRALGVDTVYLVGVATDYCVKFTALDAVKEGFATHLVTDGVRGVELAPGDVHRALEELSGAGVHLVERRDVS